MHYIFESQLREISYNLFNGYFKKSKNQAARVAQSAKSMYNGDMWDGGRGYIGPDPVDNDEDAKQIYLDLRKRFTGRNCVEEVTERMVDALLSRSPGWIIYDTKNILSRTQQRSADRDRLERRLEEINNSILSLLGKLSPEQETEIRNRNTVPVVDNPPPDVLDQNSRELRGNTPTNPKIAEAELLLSEIWTTFNLKEKLELSFAERLVVGEGKTRIRFSSKFKDVPESDETSDIFELFTSVLKYIKVEQAENSTTKILNDDGDLLGITKIDKSSRYKSGIEVSFVEDSSGKTFVISLEKERQKTIAPDEVTENESVETLYSEDAREIPEIIADLKSKGDISTGFSLDGNILVDEIKGKPYISESMLQQNRALNLDLSLATGVLVESGYQEMVTTNVQLEDEVVSDPYAVGGSKTVKQSLKRGPTTSNNLIGVKSVDQYGTIHYQQPGVTFKDPTPLTTFDVGENLFYRQILNEARQAYVLNSKDYNVSGESKIQSRQDFLKKAVRYKASVDSHGGWLLTTILHLVATLSGQDGYFEGLAVMFDTRVSAGELSSDEKNALILQQEKGLIDKETAMVLLGIEDPILTLDKIRLDQAEALEYEIKKMIAEQAFGKQTKSDDEGIQTGEDESVRSKNNKNVNMINQKKVTKKRSEK